jgi:hypothetical protein
MKIILRSILIYFFIAGIIIVASSFFLLEPPSLPYGGTKTFKIAGALKIFFDALSAVLCGGFVCGAARAFSDGSRTYGVRFSPSIVRGFQETVICALICTALVFAANEIGTPLLSRAQRNVLMRTDHLSEYLSSARRHIENGEYFLAKKYLNNALEIDANNVQALSLFSRAEYGEAERQAVQSMGIDEERIEYAPPRVFPGEEKYTVYELLLKADEAYAKESWFDAHYYASAALGLTTDRDPNAARAKRLASEAWNHLANPTAFKDSTAAAFFAKKREGYRALMETDNLKAYYIFEQLNGQNGADPDVAHFLSVSSERVRASYFFLEDVPDISSFSDISNIYFAVKNPDGSRDIVFIKGIAPLRDSGKIVLFLRGLSVVSYNASGAFEMSYIVPFAKMFAQSVADFDEGSRLMLGAKTPDQNIPCIMLEGVDSRTGAIVMKPVFTFADDDLPEYELPFALLAMPYDDLLLLLDMGKGAESAQLDSLFKFYSKADSYGFSKETYLHSLYTRISFPLVFFLLMIISGIVAWNFRMAQAVLFKLRWIFIPPVISGIAYLLIKAIEFFIDTSVYTVVAVGKGASPAFIIACFVFLFIALAVIFVSRRDAR